MILVVYLNYSKCFLYFVGEYEKFKADERRLFDRIDGKVEFTDLKCVVLFEVSNAFDHIISLVKFPQQKFPNAEYVATRFEIETILHNTHIANTCQIFCLANF